MLVGEFPELSETYVKWEIETLLDRGVEVRVVGLQAGAVPYRTEVAHLVTTDEDEAFDFFRELGPDVVHTHYVVFATRAGRLASRLGVPFTVRSHSFDVLNMARSRTLSAKEVANRKALTGPSCLGILTLPFNRDTLVGIGVSPARVIDCFPVVKVGLFLDETPNERGVMNVGAPIPKKRMEDFISLAERVPDQRFTLYTGGYDNPTLAAANESVGDPVEIAPAIEPASMPREYKKHDWLVYTASREIGTVGWPVAVAEAQASGVGVCVPNLRPDLRDYVGPEGYLYDSVEELIDLVREPPTQEQRDLGFELSKRSDIDEHIDLLLSLWERA